MTHRIPLLHDHHNHPLLYAAFMDGVDLNPPGETREQAIRRIREAAAANPHGWTIAHGWNSGRYHLTTADFADAPPVLVVNVSIHGFLVNDAGGPLLRDADPEVADHIDDADWVERHLRRVLNLFARAGSSAERLRRFFDWLLRAQGVWHAEEMLLVGGDEIRLFDEAGVADRTRFWAAPEALDALPSAERRRVHGIKLFTDGAIGTRTAALSQPYRDDPQPGLLIHGDEDLRSLLERADLPVAVHAIGDRAIDQVVAAVADARPNGPIRIEHAQLISEATARRAKALGIAFCMQPNFSDDSIHYAGRLPAGFAERNNPFRMLIDRVGYVPGEDLLLGSDGMPHGAAEALRQSLFPPFDAQRLTIDEFVAGYCRRDLSTGHVDVSVDVNARTVACVVSATG